MASLAGDPVQRGFVASLRRPSTNITGVALTSESQMTAKRLELIREALPRARRIAVLAERTINQTQVEEAERAARVLGLKFVVVPVSEDGYDRAFSTMRAEGAEALVVLASTTFSRDRMSILVLAERYRLPTIYDLREMAAEGGLMSYGPDVSTLSQRLAAYIDRIFKGAHPAELPVEQPWAFTLAVNLKTAKALGLTVPTSILTRADQIIE